MLPPVLSALKTSVDISVLIYVSCDGPHKERYCWLWCFYFISCIPTIWVKSNCRYQSGFSPLLFLPIQSSAQKSKLARCTKIQNSERLQDIHFCSALVSISLGAKYILNLYCAMETHSLEQLEDIRSWVSNLTPTPVITHWPIDQNNNYMIRDSGRHQAPPPLPSCWTLAVISHFEFLVTNLLH